MSDQLPQVITDVRTALLSVFNPASQFPPDGGGSTTCRIVAGDVVPLELWDAHSRGGDNCGEPFLWVRAMRRFRSKKFPAPIMATDCATQPVVELEIGVGRCSALSAEPDWEEMEDEADISLDDCFRIEQALCRAVSALTDHGRTVGTGTIEPYGPEGGVVAWRSTLFVSL